MNAEIMHLDLPDHTAETVTGTGRRASTALLNDLRVTLDIRLGSLDLTVRELMAVETGALLELDRDLHDDIDVLLNGKVIARGQIVAVDDRFGIRITAIQHEA